MQISIRDRVFNSLLFFLEHRDEEVQLKALTGLGTVPLSVNTCSLVYSSAGDDCTLFECDIVH